jgi:hypothetical protein
MYAQKIEGDQWVGDKLDEQKLSKMSGECDQLLYCRPVTKSMKDEQIHQLYELMQAIQNRGKEGGEQES